MSDTPPQFILTHLYDDPEIAGRIFIQLQSLFAAQLLADSKDQFYRHAFAVMHKLVAMRYHLRNYERIEDELFVAATEKFKSSVGAFQTSEEFSLIAELEAFLFQLKSALDMLVKLMTPVLGKDRVKTATFSKDGDDLKKGLERLARRPDANSKAIGHLLQVIEHHQEWIRHAISFRDGFNHFEGLKDYKFLPEKSSSGEIVAKRPRLVSHLETRDYLQSLYHNSLIFHQDFMVYALAIKAPPVFYLGQQEEEAAVREFGAFGKYVKFCWFMDTPAATK